MKLILGNDEQFISECVDRVTSPVTIYTNGKPRPNGLLCERIFGPVNNYSCNCGKLNGIIWNGRTCTKCNVIVGKKDRSKFSYIDLNYYCLNHLLVKELARHFFKTSNIYNHIIKYPNFNLQISDKATKFKIYTDILDHYGIKYDNTLKIIDSNGESYVFVRYTTTNNNDNDIITIGLFYKSIGIFFNELIDKDWYMNKEKSNILDIIDNDFSKITTKIVRILPAKYRDIQKVGDMIRIDTINEVYKTILNIDLRIRKMDSIIDDYKSKNELDEISSIESFINFEYATLVDLIYKLYYKSLSIQNMKCNNYKKIIHGKRGLVRGKLLGRRVSFSARTVIVGDSKDGENISEDSILVPFLIAKNLIRLHLYKFMNNKKKLYYKQYEEMSKCNHPEYIDAMKEYVEKNKPIVIIGRQPSLYKHSMLAFYMKINFNDLQDKTLKLNPLYNGLLNADYDGDTCYISLVISKQGYEDAKNKIFLSKNKFLDKNNNSSYNFSIEYIYGLWFATNKKLGSPSLKWTDDSYLCDYDSDGKTYGYKRIEKIFNNFNIDINKYLNKDIVLNKKNINKLVNSLISNENINTALNILNELKNLSIDGFTESGLTISLGDIDVVEKDISKLDLDNDIKYQNQINEITNHHFEKMSSSNNFKKIINSGTKGDVSQIQTLLVSKGVLLDCSGNKMNPILNSIGEGLSAQDYIDSVKGSRKGLVDKSVSTAISGYFTARITKSMRDYIISDNDCKSNIGILLPIDEAINRTSLDTIDGVILKDEVFTSDTIKKFKDIYGEDEYVEVRSPLFCNYKKDNKCCVKCYGHINSTREEPEIGYNIGVNTATTLSEIITQMVLKNFHTSGSFRTQYEEIVAERDYDNLDIIEYRDYLLININDLKYLVSKKECIINKKSNISKGDLVFKYPKSIDDITNAYLILDNIMEGRKVSNKAIICKKDGTLVMKSFDESIYYRDSKIPVSQIKIPYKNNILYLSIVDDSGVEIESIKIDLNEKQLKIPLGSKVNKGDIITTGEINYNELYKVIDMNSYIILLENIDLLYKSVGVKVDYKHIEVLISHIFRSNKIKGVTTLTKDKSFINHMSIGYFYDSIIKSLKKYNKETMDEEDNASKIANNRY